MDDSIRDLCSPWRGVKLQEGVLEGVVQLHDGGLVAAPVAVVGGGEDGDHVAVVGPVVALHHQLVGAGHQGQPVRVVESLGYILQTAHGQALLKLLLTGVTTNKPTCQIHFCSVLVHS